MDKINYNPDILSCLANLSNDEVFTPPEIANKVIDLLPKSIFEDKNTTFLDPVCKSGVFLREIAKRLNDGLMLKIPDQQERLNHIFKKQLFGLGITEITSLLSRRSVYCSKKANGKYSLISNFDNDQGNILFDNIDHEWIGNKCKFCGASENNFNRDEELESHAYQFIHTNKPEEIFNMKFDVIIGNPPYQLSTAGDDNGAQAKPIYHLFVEQALKLNPRYLTMIIPARWFAGGWGLDNFREMMINNKMLKEIHDYPDASECFTGPEIKGGVCYFLMDRFHKGETNFITYKSGKAISHMMRNFKKEDTDLIIRYNEGISILNKIKSHEEKSFDDLVSTKKPFGFLTNFKGKAQNFAGSVKLYGNRNISYVKRDEILRRANEVDKFKLIVPKAVGSGDANTDRIKPIYSEPNSCCTETYLLVGPFRDKNECDNVMSYIETKFFHFLVTLQKNTQDCMKKVYSFVPIQDFNKQWNDKLLYEKYNLTNNEIDFIEKTIWNNSNKK